MIDKVSWLYEAAGNARMQRYACPTCEASIVTTAPINTMFFCTLREEVLVELAIG